MNIPSPNGNADRSRNSNATSATQSSRYTQLIASWDLKFDGSSHLSVENFISRVEYQVQDVLNSDSNILCEHAH